MTKTNLMSRKKPVIFLIIILAATGSLFGQIGSGFESGFQGWTREGDPASVTLDSTHTFAGKFCARLGNRGRLFRRIPVTGLSILRYELYVKCSSEKLKPRISLRFYGRENKEILEYPGDYISSMNYEKMGDYTEAPPGTDYITIGVERNDSDSGFVYLDDLSVTLNIGEPVRKHPVRCNLDQYMKPFWKSDTVFNETVLLYSVHGQPASGRLLFSPSAIISVRSFDLKKTFIQGRDYLISGNQLTRPAGSSMPFRADTSFDSTHDLSWYNLQSQWVVITYTHKDAWLGPTPGYKGNRLSRVMTKLKTGAPLTILAYGMSLTRGMSVSGYDTVSPYMPGYVELFSRELSRNFRNSQITLYNAGLPGARVDWGAAYAAKYVNPLKPDLIILDFGMNDFWKYSPAEFKDYVRRIMDTVIASNPAAEFLLLSNMMFDPDYVLDSDKNKSFYTGNLAGYQLVLHQLEGEGSAELDMTHLSDAIYRRKKAKDCISNPLHPNDYMARWYAQGMVAIFTR